MEWGDGDLRDVMDETVEWNDAAAKRWEATMRPFVDAAIELARERLYIVGTPAPKP